MPSLGEHLLGASWCTEILSCVISDPTLCLCTWIPVSFTQDPSESETEISSLMESSGKDHIKTGLCLSLLLVMDKKCCRVSLQGGSRVLVVLTYGISGKRDGGLSGLPCYTGGAAAGLQMSLSGPWGALPH